MCVKSLSACSGVFSTGAVGALAPAMNIGTIYYCHRPLARAILGQSITVSTRNSKVLNTPLNLGVVEESYYQSGLFEDLLEDIDYYHESQQVHHQ